MHQHLSIRAYAVVVKCKTGRGRDVIKLIYVHLGQGQGRLQYLAGVFTKKLTPPPRKSAGYCQKSQKSQKAKCSARPFIVFMLVGVLMTHTAFAQAQDQSNHTSFGIGSFGSGSGSGTMLTQQFGMQSFYAPLASLPTPSNNATAPDANAADYGGRYRMTTRFALTPLLAEGWGWYQLGFGHWRKQNRCQTPPCLWLGLPSRFGAGN